MIEKKKFLKYNYNEYIIHQLILYYNKKKYFFTKKTKNRSEVSGGGKKPWQQKGTGRSRVGSTRNPIWRGGGHVFAFKFTKKKIKINKNIYKLVMNIILFEKFNMNKIKLITINKLNIKMIIKKLILLNLKNNSLLILNKKYIKFFNLKNKIFKIKTIHNIYFNPILLIKYNYIVLTDFKFTKIFKC